MVFRENKAPKVHIFSLNYEKALFYDAWMYMETTRLSHKNVQAVPARGQVIPFPDRGKNDLRLALHNIPKDFGEYLSFIAEIISYQN